MWNRKELKAKGKAAFRANYWRSVLVGLLVLVIISSGAAAGKNGTDKAADQLTAEQSAELQNTIEKWKAAFEKLTTEERQTVVLVIVGALGGIILIHALVDILIINPLEVGCRRFFLVNSDQPAALGEVGYGFRNNYGNTVLTILLRDLYLALWACLFVIPAIVKSYSYRLVPYILADDPTVKPGEAIKRSRELMRGHKWNAFMLDLSFIGWDILAALTAGIVGALYTSPYQCATDAELYKAIAGKN